MKAPSYRGDSKDQAVRPIAIGGRIVVDEVIRPAVRLLVHVHPAVGDLTDGQ
jgi:hypothetical protein